MSKRDLIFSRPLMNAAGMLGFFPERHGPLPWAEFGAFVTNPVSQRPRAPADSPACLPYPGGFLLHNGLPNPGFQPVLRKYARRWRDSDLPIIVHLMVDRPEETARMVRSLEGIENILAVELGFAPFLSDDILLLALEMSLGELPLIVNLPSDQFLRLGPALVSAGAQALSLAPPRGRLDLDGRQVSGRLYGPGLFPQTLEIAQNASRLGLPVIGAGGVYSREQAQALLQAGALAIQLDSVLWKTSW
jgi:dihydroorotate dehydrogenase (NAD+) catalytic subunit